MKQDDWGPWKQGQQNQNQNMNQGTPPGYQPHQGGGYPGGYPPYGGGYPPGYKPPGSGLAIAALVLGILSLVFWVAYIGYVIMAPLAIIFGALAKRQGNSSGMATAGIVMGIISIAGALLFWIACVAICAAVATPAFWF